MWGSQMGRNNVRDVEPVGCAEMWTPGRVGEI